MIFTKAVIKEKICEIADRPWYPVEIAQVNNQIVRIALYKGEYSWHKHNNDDEFFYVVEGTVIIQLKEPYSNIILRKGESVVIPKGVEHCPKSSLGAYVLMVEPNSLNLKGD